MFAIFRRSFVSAAVIALAVLFVAPTGTLAAGQAPEAPAEASGAPAAGSAEYRAVLNRYCTTCHNDRLQTAGLTLESLDMVHVGEGAETWEKVIRKLRAREMPPPRRPRPDDATYVAFVDWIETALDRAAGADLNPGTETVHRLNRTEYTNAIRDLLALEIDGRELLPADDLSYGFDNIADVLSLSPSLLERYMLAAGKIAEMAVGDPSIRSTTAVYTTSPVLMQHARMSELHPFGSRGGFATRHYFPVAGEYEFRVHAGADARATPSRGCSTATRSRSGWTAPASRASRSAPTGSARPWNAVFNLTPYERNADSDLRFRMPVQAGMREVALSFLRRGALPEGVLEPVSAAETYHYAGDRDAPMAVWIVEIDGPFNGATASADSATPSRERIFTCLPDDPVAEPACAEEILDALARRAFRRPVTEGDVAALMAFYDVGHAKGGFESGIEFALRAILVDPEFLFRIEQDPADAAPGAPYRISDLELASRLSFFLWSSIPDDELLDAAARGALRDEGVLAAQVKRMLADPKAASLVDNFAGQWLFLRNMRSVKPDPVAFRSSTATCARPSRARPSSGSRARSRRTAASSRC